MPILLVTDRDEDFAGGAVINFIDAPRTVRFEVSLVAADRARLSIDSALLAVAARVQRRALARRVEGLVDAAQRDLRRAEVFAAHSTAPLEPHRRARGGGPAACARSRGAGPARLRSAAAWPAALT
jgi:hypothetical protein